MGRRCIGMDVHREFAQLAVWENGKVRQDGKIGLTAEALRGLCDSLEPEDEVAIEATCNTHAIVRLIKPYVPRVVVSNPQKTRAIAEAKVKPTRSTRRSSLSCSRRTFCRRCGSLMRPRTRCVVSAAGEHRAAAHAAEEPGAGDSSPQPDPALPGRGLFRDQGPVVAG
jgi:hypothetical protein